jgi:hypothetical protein
VVGVIALGIYLVVEDLRAQRNQTLQDGSASNP